MKTQLNKSETTTSKEPQKTVVFSMVHLLFLHAVLVNLEKEGTTDKQLGEFLTDLIFLFEHHIDTNEDKDLQKHMNYQPLKD